MCPLPLKPRRKRFTIYSDGLCEEGGVKQESKDAPYSLREGEPL